MTGRLLGFLLVPLAVAFEVGICLLSLLLWVPNRLTSQRCPNCGSKWRTELIGEWDGEDWYCHRCRQFWKVK